MNSNENWEQYVEYIPGMDIKNVYIPQKSTEKRSKRIQLSTEELNDPNTQLQLASPRLQRIYSYLKK